MLDIWYVALPISCAKFVQMKMPGFKMARGRGPRFKPKKYIKILKNLLLQNCLAKMLKILYIALPCGPLPSCSSEGPRVRDGPVPGGPRFKS